MKVKITVGREFEMNEARVLGDPGFEPPAADASLAEKRAWLEESFFELCGFERDQDHIDGSYVRRLPRGEFVDVEFEWPEALGDA